MQIFVDKTELVTWNQLYQLLGIHNLLTDNEMNIANAIKSPAAEKAITNITYKDGISSFHYCGVTDYERINWKFSVQPNTNYKMIINATSSAKMLPLDSFNSFLPWGINTVSDIQNTTHGDIANYHMPVPWQGKVNGSMTFNSGNRTELYLITNFGFLIDAIPTDISLKIELVSADSLQSQIDALKVKIK